MTHTENIERALGYLDELTQICSREGGRQFLGGLFAAIRSLSDQSLRKEERWSNASSIYRTMMGSKSGFSDFYLARPTTEQVLFANQRLDHLREELWRLLG